MVNSIVRSVHFETIKSFLLPFKITIQFDQGELLLYCGEIYEEADGTLSYKANDKILLAFDNRQEAKKFEDLINYA